MLKINRAGYVFDSNPVELVIENVPEQPEESDEEGASAEEIARYNEIKKAEEEKRRFNDEVDMRVNEILSAHRDAVNKEAQKIIDTANANAQLLSENAKSSAAEALRKAQAECDSIKEQAHNDGFAAGFDEGKKTAEKKCASYLEAAASFLGEINSHKEAYYISNEEELRKTVVEAVEKIVLEKLHEDDKIVERIIGQAAKNFRNSDFLKVMVLESEVSKEFRTDKEYVRNIAAGIPEIEIEYLPPDETAEGTVVLDNGSEIIDASVPTQLEFLKEIVGNSGRYSED